MPRTCPCCAVPVAYGAGSPLCEACLPQLRSALAKVERVYALQPLDGAAAPEVRAASRYEGIMPRALLALKNAAVPTCCPCWERVWRVACMSFFGFTGRGFSRSLLLQSRLRFCWFRHRPLRRVCAAAAMRRRIFWCRRRRVSLISVCLPRCGCALWTLSGTFLTTGGERRLHYF